ncbi:MAG: PfkB family carbohydrate kinase [Nannocystaceae bacterium]|nr:adenylyltransferase/cytidyltransferase family protein [Myxococcales bacterium]
MSAFGGKLLDLDALVRVREGLRAAGKTVVQCHGYFDIVHPGHIRYLRFARQQGDALIVSVTADHVASADADRPYIREELRLESLAALELVDYVYLDPNPWAGPVLEAVRPDVFVKGKEYEERSSPQFARERALVEGYGGKVIFSSGDVVYSSTHLLDRFGDRLPLTYDKVADFCRRNELDHEALARALRSARGQRVLVLGDPVFDRYIHCDAERLAAEEPMIQVSPLREDWYLGAGALVARQLTALGAQACFVTPARKDALGARFSRELEGAGVEVRTIVEDARPIYVKTRYLVEERKLFKVNEGRYTPLSTRATAKVIASLRELLPRFDAMVVLDFGYGMFGHELCQAVADLSRELAVPYFVDVSGSPRANILKFKHPRLATPTEGELRAAFADDESGISFLAMRYYRESGAGELVATMGKRGVVLFDPPPTPQTRLATDYLPSLARSPIDTVGAGDVFLATMCASALGGNKTAAGAYLASCVSAIHVQQLGNDVVDIVDLERFIAGRRELARGASCDD